MPQGSSLSGKTAAANISENIDLAVLLSQFERLLDQANGSWTAKISGCVFAIYHDLTGARYDADTGNSGFPLAGGVKNSFWHSLPPLQ